MNPIVLTTITALLTLITAGLSLGASLANRRKLDNLVPKITELHLTMNSRLDELLRITRSEAHAAGVAEGEQMERERK